MGHVPKVPRGSIVPVLHAVHEDFEIEQFIILTLSNSLESHET